MNNPTQLARQRPLKLYPKFQPPTPSLKLDKRRETTKHEGEVAKKYNNPSMTSFNNSKTLMRKAQSTKPTIMRKLCNPDLHCGFKHKQ